jgi:radical SAM protein with 4Fe4S-binding SPASM domain
MTGTDTWNPGVDDLRKDEVETLVDSLGPSDSEKYAERENKDRQGECNFCGYTTAREFCGGKCETAAAFATMGKSLKFHE